MISVIILTHNRLPMLRRCVESILKNSGPDYEIIIIDNGSTDGTPEALSAVKGLKILRFERGVELSKCRNAGIDAARGGAIAFTDDDCVVAEDWLSRIARDLESFDAVGGAVKPYGDIKKPWWWHDELNWMPGLSVPGLYGPLAGEVYLPQSANLAYRTDILKKLRFSENFDGIWQKNMTREDSDLWMRTRDGGYRTLIDTDLTVYHKLPASRFTIRFCAGRAFSDGFAAYHREDGEKFWRLKLDFLFREPFRLLAKSGSSRSHRVFWIIREGGYVYAHFARALDISRKVSRVKRGFSKLVFAGYTLAVIIVEGTCLLLAGAALKLGWRGKHRH